MTQREPQPGSRRSSLRCSDRETKRLVAAIVAAGGEVKLGRAGHIKVYLEGRQIGSMPSTPSEYRSRKNTIADLRRAGLAIDTKGNPLP